MKKLKQALSFLISTLVMVGFTLPTKFRSMGHAFWLDLLSKLAAEPFSLQQQAIEEQLGDMLSYYEQRDDITVISLKVQR